MHYFIVLFILLLSALKAQASPYQWQLAKQDHQHNIKIFTSKVEHSNLDAFRGEMLIKEKLWRLLALLNDTAQAPKWIHNCENMRLLEQKNSHQAIYYSVTRAPWPLLNRDAVSLVRTEIEPHSGIVTLTMQAVNNVISKQKKHVRIPMLKGFWRFVPMPKQTIKVIYQMHADPGGDIPAWVANALVVDIPYNTLKNMRKMLKTNDFKQLVPALMRQQQNLKNH